MNVTRLSSPVPQVASSTDLGSKEPLLAYQLSLSYDGTIATSHKRGIRAVFPSQDAKSVITASADGLLCTWNSSTLTMQSCDSVVSKHSHRVVGKEEQLTDVAFLPSSGRCVPSFESASCYVRDASFFKEFFDV